MSEEENKENSDGAVESATQNRDGKSQPNEKRKSDADEKRGDEGDQKKEESRKESKEDDKKGAKRPSKKVLIIAGIVVAGLALGGLIYYLHARNYESTDDAFTTGHVHEISARVAGTIEHVLVDDNEVVRQGQPLVRLDEREFKIALDKAEAQLAQAQASVAQAEAETAQRAAAREQAEAQLWKAQTDFDRATSLFQKDLKAVSRSDVDAMTAGLKTAKGAYTAAKANEDASRAQEVVAKAGVQTAETAVHDAELQFSYTVIGAPVDGFVARKTAESGRRIQAGQALMAVVERSVWVIANLKETQLAKVKIGQAVSIDIDAIPGHVFQGHVDSFQPGTGAVFSLLPPDNATGNFTKIVQRVPVKIVFEPESVRGFENRISPGLSVMPKIDLRSR